MLVSFVWLKSKDVMPEPSVGFPDPNALLSILLTLSGILIVCKLGVFWNALCPILVKLLGSLTLLRLVQPWKRLAGNVVSWVEERSMVVREVQPEKIEVVV